MADLVDSEEGVHVQDRRSTPDELPRWTNWATVAAGVVLSAAAWLTTFGLRNPLTPKRCATNAGQDDPSWAAPPIA